jgi:hypothetical protein
MRSSVKSLASCATIMLSSAAQAEENLSNHEFLARTVRYSLACQKSLPPKADEAAVMKCVEQKAQAHRFDRGPAKDDQKTASLKRSGPDVQAPAAGPYASADPGGATSDAQDQAFRQFLIRSDLLDNRFYAFGSSGSGAAKGASISYTDNRLATTSTGAISPTQNVTIAGIASLLLLDKTQYPHGLGLGDDTYFAPALWIYGNGTWDQPTKPTTDFSAVKTGSDFQFVHVGPTATEFLGIAPYYQTDLSGQARIFGTSVAGELIYWPIHLGQTKVADNPILNGYWAFRPEVDLVDVVVPGFTKLSVGNHDWFGETARGYVYLFPTCPTCAQTAIVPTWLADKLLLIGTAQYFWDDLTRTNAAYYSVELQLNIGGCNTNETQVGSAGKVDCGSQGTTAISFEYDWGVDKDTLFKVGRYLGKLSFKY